MLFSARQTIVFTGDSITDAGRERDFDAKAAMAKDDGGQTWCGTGLGGGYVRDIVHFLNARRPELGLRCVNTGVSGDTVAELEARWDKDVIAFQPDWLSILIGVNDIERSANQGRTEVNVQGYEKIYRRLLTRVLKETPAKLILWHPFFAVTPNPCAPNAEKYLDSYIAVVDRLAAEIGPRCVAVIPTQKLFAEAAKKRWAEFWLPDGVHPTGPGHAMMADAFLRVVGAGA